MLTDGTTNDIFDKIKMHTLMAIDQHLHLDKLQEELQGSITEMKISKTSMCTSEIQLKQYIKIYSELSGICIAQVCENIFVNELLQMTSKLEFVCENNTKVKYLMLLIKNMNSYNQDAAKAVKINIHQFKHSFPINILLELHKNDILHIQEFLKQNVNDNNILKEFAYGMQQCCMNEEMTNRMVAAEVLSDLITCAYQTGSIEDKSMQKICQHIVHFVLKYVLIKTADSDNKNSKVNESIFHFLWSNKACDAVSLQSCVTHQLSAWISHNPVLKVSDAVIKQINWKYCCLSTSLLELHKQILRCCGLDHVISVIRKVLSKREVNWKYLLSFFSSIIVNHKEAVSLFEEFIVDELKKGLDESCSDHLVIGFLLARQCSMEGSHIFMSYSDWFEKYFCSGTNCLINSSRGFRFFITFLSSLVPCEPARFLRIHLSKSPHLPNQLLRNTLLEYNLLAKTRLDDFKSSALNTHDADSHAIAEVNAAVELFAKNKKVSPIVMEMSIFRRTFYFEKFLPALLKERPLPDIEDTKMKLITALFNLGKIPTSLYGAYKEKCAQESVKLYDGIKDVIDDFESTNDCMEQLKFNVNRYFYGNSEKDSTKAQITGQSIHKILHNLLCTSHGDDDVDTNENTTDLKTTKKIPETIKLIIESMLDGLTSSHHFSIEENELVNFMKILQNHSILKEGLCRFLWDICTLQCVRTTAERLFVLCKNTLVKRLRKIREEDFTPSSGLVVFLLGSCISPGWLVTFESEVDYSCEIRHNRNTDNNKVTSLGDAVITSLPYYTSSTSFVNISKLLTALVKQLDSLKGLSEKMPVSVLMLMKQHLSYSHGRIESYLTYNKGFSLAKRRKVTETGRFQCLIKELTVAIVSIKEILSNNFALAESTTSLTMDEFVKREIWMSTDKDYMTDKHRTQFYKAMLYHNDIQVYQLESLVHFLLNQWPLLFEQGLGNKEMVVFLCSHLPCLLRSSGDIDVPKWFLKVVSSRMESLHRHLQDTNQINKPLATQREISLFCELLIHLPCSFMLHCTFHSCDDVTLLQPVKGKTEDVCRSLSIFYNKFLCKHSFDMCFAAELTGLVFGGIIQNVSEKSELIFSHLCTSLPLLVVSLLVCWKFLPDIHCLCKIKKPKLHDLLCDLHQTLTSSSEYKLKCNLYYEADPIPVCVALILLRKCKVPLNVIKMLAPVFGDVCLPMACSLISYTCYALENNIDFDLSLLSCSLEHVLRLVTPNCFCRLMENPDSRLGFIFPMLSITSYHNAVAKLLNQITIPLNILNYEGFLPSLLTTLNKSLRNTLQVNEANYQGLVVKAARHSTNLTIKSSLQEDHNPAMQSILKAELRRRFH